MLKKILLISLILAIAVCVSGCIVNYRTYNEQNRLKWASKHHGGEITVEYGFGWHAVHIYGMSPEDHDSHKIEFSLLSAVLSFVSVYVICVLLCFAVAAIIKAKKH